jgi:hypothetical protein
MARSCSLLFKGSVGHSYATDMPGAICQLARIWRRILCMVQCIGRGNDDGCAEAVLGRG